MVLITTVMIIIMIIIVAVVVVVVMIIMIVVVVVIMIMIMTIVVITSGGAPGSHGAPGPIRESGLCTCLCPPPLPRRSAILIILFVMICYSVYYTITPPYLHLMYLHERPADSPPSECATRC